MIKQLGARFALRAASNELDVAISAVQAGRTGDELARQGRRALTALQTGLVRVDDVLGTVGRSSTAVETVATIAPELALAARGVVGLITPHGETLRDVLEGGLESGKAPPEHVKQLAKTASVLRDAADAVGEVVAAEAPDAVADFLDSVAGGLRNSDDLRADEEAALTTVLGAMAALVRWLCQLATIFDNADVVAALTRAARNLSAAAHDYLLPHLETIGALLAGESIDDKNAAALERGLLLVRGVLDGFLKA